MAHESIDKYFVVSALIDNKTLITVGNTVIQDKSF